MQERLTAPPLPMNTHWIASLVTGGTGSFITVKEMVTESPVCIGLLLIPSEGDTLGGTGTKQYYILINNVDYIHLHKYIFVWYSALYIYITFTLLPPNVVTFTIAMSPHPMV